MKTHSTDVRIREVETCLLPVRLRMPLKFGRETVTEIVCLRTRMHIEDRKGRAASGWGESPISVAWGWPSSRPYAEREKILLEFCQRLAAALASFSETAHPVEIGFRFQEEVFPGLIADFNKTHGEQMPKLAALIGLAPFDLALHDAFGRLHNRPVYSTYGEDFMNRDLSGYLEPASGTDVSFAGRYPHDFFRAMPLEKLPAWHLVGGMDPLDESELTGDEPQDGYPVLLRDWIRTDGLKCLKIKLRGNDAAWDCARIEKVGRIAIEEGCDWLTADFNCLAPSPDYVNDILDLLRDTTPRIYGMILYVEQPFPYELEDFPIDVHSLSARKPLFLDESAHDWKAIRLGRQLGWNGVALKTCKTQTSALLSGCWAAAHGMALMVQDLTNPMLAQIPHVLLAAHFPTVMGVESNACQFYPEASRLEAAIHPGLYRRRQGSLSLESIEGSGFGYRMEEISRDSVT